MECFLFSLKNELRRQYSFSLFPLHRTAPQIPKGNLLGARPVDIVLDEMERIRQKDRTEKALDQHSPTSPSYRLHSTDITSTAGQRKRVRSGKRLTKQRPVVEWRFIHDGRIPRILTMDAYLRKLQSENKWNFSSDDDELENKLSRGMVRNIVGYSITPLLVMLSMCKQLNN